MPIPKSRQAEFATMLRVNSFFAGLDPSEIEALATLCRTRSVPAGTTLFLQGDAGDAMYGIRRGQVTIQVDPLDSEPIVIASLGTGDIFGEVALLDGHGRTADAIIAEDTELFVLHRPDVLAYIERAPRVAIKLIEMVCLKLRSTLGQLEQTLTLKLDARLASRLTTLAQDFGETLSITQEHLARHVGATRGSVNRQLQVWQDGGLIKLSRGQILIKDEKKLSAIARSCG